MSNTPFTPTSDRNIKKIILIAVGSVIIIGLIGYGTITLLKQFKAPTVTDNKQTQQPAATPKLPSAAEALTIADKAKAAAIEKVNAGNQKDALKDYQIAYDNYKIAGNELETKNTQFIIQSIQAVVTAEATPKKPVSPKAAAKE
jgi:hypothetical protein